MTPAVYDITIYKGDTFTLPIRIKDSDGVYVNLTGWTARSQIRTTAGGLVASLTITFSNQTTTPGEVTASLSPAATAALSITTGVYDVEFTTSTGLVKTYLAGTVTVIDDVTRT